MSTREFEIQLNAFRDEDIPEAFGDLMGAIGLQALRGVVLKTPVDKGVARGGWITTIGHLDLSFSLSKSDKSGSAPIAEGTPKFLGLKANPFVFIAIQNNLPYIEALEDGSSKQAPAGMLTTTVAEIESQFA